MSRIGKLPIEIPKDVTITISDSNLVTVKGKNGELQQQIDPDIILKQEDSTIIIERPTEQKRHKALHGLSRSLIDSMVYGVSKGYEIKQVLEGVGYRADVKGRILELSLGYSHNILFQMPDEVKVEVVTEKRKAPVVTLKSADKQLIGQIAAKIRSFRPPEPYKGKGIRFVGEHIRRKAGKQAAAAAAS